MAETRIDKLRDQLASLRAEVREAADDCDSVARQDICSEGERRTWKNMANRLRSIAKDVV